VEGGQWKQSPTVRSDIAALADQQRLKTKSNLWRDVYGSSLGSWGQAVAANWLFVVAVAVAGLILGTVGAVPVVRDMLGNRSAPAAKSLNPKADTFERDRRASVK
jgi:hypothetical protein